MSKTLTTEQVRQYTPTGLRLVSEAIAVYIGSLAHIPDSGLYGDYMTSLHVVALEMNRRHGHACEQEIYDLPNALDVICYAQFDKKRNVTETSIARAYGVILDHGDDDDWGGLKYFALTPKRVRGYLHTMALTESPTV